MCHSAAVVAAFPRGGIPLIFAAAAALRKGHSAHLQQTLHPLTFTDLILEQIFYSVKLERTNILLKVAVKIRLTSPVVSYNGQEYQKNGFWTTQAPPELVKALAEWIDAHDAPDANWETILHEALAEVEIGHQGDMSDEEAFENPVESFRRGWRDVVEGNTIPASELLDAFNDEA